MKAPPAPQPYRPPPPPAPPTNSRTQAPTGKTGYTSLAKPAKPATNVSVGGIVSGVLGALAGAGAGAGVVSAPQYAIGAGAASQAQNIRNSASGVYNAVTVGKAGSEKPGSAVQTAQEMFGRSSQGRSKFESSDRTPTNPYAPTDPRYALWEQYGSINSTGVSGGREKATGQKKAPVYRPEPRITAPTISSGAGGSGGAEETPGPDYGGYGYSDDGYGRGFGDDGGYAGGYGAADAMTLTWRISA